MRWKHHQKKEEKYVISIPLGFFFLPPNLPHRYGPAIPSQDANSGCAGLGIDSLAAELDFLRKRKSKKKDALSTVFFFSVTRDTELVAIAERPPDLAHLE